MSVLVQVMKNLPVGQCEVFTENLFLFVLAADVCSIMLTAEANRLMINVFTLHLPEETESFNLYKTFKICK